MKSGCSKDHTTFACWNSSCSPWRRLLKSEEDSRNWMKCVWNDLKTRGQNLNF
jgi:hypothetical protein